MRTERKTTNRREFEILVVLLAALSFAGPASAQIAPEAERNVSRMLNYQNECSIAVNPTNTNQLFAACNNATGGIFFARSTDRGNTWVFPDADRTLADGDANQGNLACCDPTLAWDTFGNLYVTYLGNAGAIETLLSTDGGQTFNILATFAGNNDQPTIKAANTTAAGAPVAVWIVWNDGVQMVARGAAVTALGTVGAFGATQNIPNTGNCSFGDVAISPAGVVVQACESPTGGQGPATIRVNTDADGLGAGNFGATVNATTTNVGGFDFIPAQNVRSVDAEAGLEYDRNPASPRFGRLYLVYTEEPVNENNDTNILVRFSDNNGGAWSAPVQVNDDGTMRSQFLPRIATNPLSGNVAVCWHDARNSVTNNQAQTFCSLATPAPAVPAFFANGQVSAGTSAGTGSNPPAAGQLDIQYGDYSGLDYFQGRFHPIWADQSNSQADNPNGTTRWDAHSNRVGGGGAANEGDPHIRTIDGVHYDFQGSGEFVTLRSADGFEVQARMTAIPTTFFPGPNPHTDLATCVSVNSAVAVRVGRQRVTYQPRLDDLPDPSGLELRIDGALTALTDAGTTLSGGGRVARSGVGGLEVQFPSGATLVATPAFWSSQGKWYMNVNVYGTDAVEGMLGAIARGSWLPALPDGSSLGAKPASASQRYQDLYVKFADAWRVTKATTLFDYAPGQSTADFTIPSWPKTSPPCDVPEGKPADPESFRVAEEVCRDLRSKARFENCVFDVAVTGETGFAKTYLATERLEVWGTTVELAFDDGERPLFVASVIERTPHEKLKPTGIVRFYQHDEPADEVPLDGLGQARWIPKDFDRKNYRVSARFIPRDSKFLGSSSRELQEPDRSRIDLLQTRPNGQ